MCEVELMSDYLTIEEASKLLNVKKQTLHTYIKQGKIPAIRLSSKTIRIPKQALIERLYQASHQDRI